MSFLPALALWRDRAGRFSPLRTVTLAVLLAPLLWLAWRAASGGLGPRPLTEALRFCGDRAIETLIAAVTVTPLRRLSGFSRLVDVRRMIGVAAFLWAVGHIGLNVADQAGDLAKVATEIAVRPWLGVGFVALVGLAALAATSTDGMIRRLGGPAWGRLHRLVHPILMLALLHFFLQIRLDPFWVAIAAGLALGGLALRIGLAQWEDRVATVVLASLAGGLGAAMVELMWFAAKTRRPIAPIALANFEIDFRIAPAWWAAAIVLAVGAAAIARSRRSPAPQRRVAVARR
jgi:sulfoxide reductase heme-binding subunit YedZ